MKRCRSDSDPSEAPSDDSDNSSEGPPRRNRANQKGSRARANKVRTLNRWTSDEHEKLAYLVEQWGSEKNWAKVAEEMPGRTGKQCRERWLNHMKPGIVKGNWAPEEEFLLAQCHALVGSHWSKMTKRLPGRTENSIKNFWNATLRSKAPNKKRGMLWTYMQLHNAKSEVNVDALVAAIKRLHASRELPSLMLAQIDQGLIGDGTWKSIHKVEREFLEGACGELHYLSLPHPTHGLGMHNGLQGHAGAPDAAAIAAAMGGGSAGAAAASPTESPVASSAQAPEYSYSQGNAQVLYPASSAGHNAGSLAASHAYMQPAGAGSHYSSAVDAYHSQQGCMGSEGMGGLLSSAAPDAMGMGGLQGSSSNGAAAAGSYSSANLLSPQDPLMRSSVQRSIDGQGIASFDSRTDMAEPNSGGAGGLNSCATLAANNGALFAAAADSAAAAAAGSVLPPPKELPPIATSAAKAGATFNGSAGTYARQPHMGPVNAGTTGGKGAGTPGGADWAPAAYNSHLPQHWSPVNSCEPACTGTPVNGSPLLNTIGSHEPQHQQQHYAGGPVLGGAPAPAAYYSSGVAAVADFARRQAGGPTYGDTRSDVDYGVAANGRPAGGHGPHCGCGPCSNSRKLHGLHSPSARRTLRNNATSAATSQRYRGMSALPHNDVAVSGGYQASKLQRQSYTTQPDVVAAPGYQLGHVNANSAYQMIVQEQQQQQVQQFYADVSTLQQQQQQQAAMAACAAQDYTAAPPAAYQQYAGSAGTAAGTAPGTVLHVTQQQLGDESPFAQHAAAGWDAAAGAEGATQAADAAAADIFGSTPWLGSTDTEQQQQLLQDNYTQQQDQQQQAAAAAAGQLLAPPQQQQGNGGSPHPAKGVDLKVEVPVTAAPDALISLLQSPLGGLFSPLKGMMLPPPSTTSVRMPSFSQIPLPAFRTSINGAALSWEDAWAGSDSQPAAAPAAAAGAAAGGDLLGVGPSGNGESLHTLLAGAGAPGATPKPGGKRPRCSVTSVEDDGALLIDMQPAKAARCSESPGAGAIYGCNNGWGAPAFLDGLN
ncbi:hypothetical protein COO60DRAFT_1700893 [Scenedesmus sp. NREL 46B-D3]|nr:hypothetical protein COO60DRAFT_1700893 [Scenedesmus sp. NREL 46B-D3]